MLLMKENFPLVTTSIKIDDSPKKCIGNKDCAIKCACGLSFADLYKFFTRVAMARDSKNDWVKENLHLYMSHSHFA